MSTILRGKAGAEDINFGLGSFPRMEGFSSKGIRMQVSMEDFPIEDLMTWYDATKLEAALEELWGEAWDTVTSAADALYDGGYISDKADWINDIIEEAANTAAQINLETEEGVDPTDTRPVITPPTPVVLYIRHPASVQPGTMAMLWIEGSGGVGPYSWDYMTNGSGGSLAVQTDTSQCIYTAGAVEVADTIIITDANGVTATATIVVSATAPTITIYGPGSVEAGGREADLRATGGATPHVWSFHEHITNSTLSYIENTGVGQSSATFTSGSEEGRDTVQVMEDGGAIAHHTIDVGPVNILDTSPIIHGRTSCEKETIVYLQVVGGETPFVWEISDDQSGATLTGLTRNPETGEIETRVTPPSPWHTELEYTAGSTSGVTDTIKVTDDDGDEDTHLIAVVEPSVASRPTIYGMESTLENQVLLLRVYGGTPPYDWEMLINNSGANLSEYENDEDGENHYTSGGSGGTELVPVQDTVRVTDANGYTDEHTISVYSDTPSVWPPSPIAWPPWWNELYGYLDGNIAPQDAIDAGAQWRTTGGSWMDSGETVEHLAVDDIVTVHFKDVDEWTTPLSQNRTIVAGANVVSGTYDEAAGAVNHFDVSITQDDYYIGKRMHFTVIARDLEGDQVTNLPRIDVKVKVDVGEIHARTVETGFVRSSASSEQEVSIEGFAVGGEHIWFVWWPDGSMPASITITVELASDSTVNGDDTAALDASASVAISTVSGADYVVEVEYEDLLLQVLDGGGDRCTYFEGDITLTPTGAGTPLISLDGTTYAGVVTYSVGPSHPNRPDIWLKDSAGDITITAEVVEHAGVTDAVVIEGSNIQFVFGSLWDAVNESGLIHDNADFDVEITAMNGGVVATTYAGECAITSTVPTLSGETDVGGGGEPAWVNGKVTVTMKVNWTTSPTELTLYCDDDAVVLNTGNRTVKTELAPEIRSENTALSQRARDAINAGFIDNYPDSFVSANSRYTSVPSYTNSSNYEIGVPGFDLRVVGKHEDYDDVIIPPYKFTRLAYGVASYYVALTNFEPEEHLFAEITFDNPAKENSVWANSDLIIRVPPVINYGDLSPELFWNAIVDDDALITIPAASIANDGVILVDLGILRANIPDGIPIQVTMQPSSATTFTWVNSNDKYHRVKIVSVKIKGY